MKNHNIVYILFLVLWTMPFNYCSDDDLKFNSSSEHNSFLDEDLLKNDDNENLSKENLFLTKLSTAISNLNIAENKEDHEKYSKEIQNLIENDPVATKQLTEFQEKMKITDNTPYIPVFLQMFNSVINQMDNENYPIAKFLYEHQFKFLNNPNFPEFAQHLKTNLTEKEILNLFEIAFKENDNNQVKNIIAQNEDILKTILDKRNPNSTDIIADGLFRSSPEIALMLENIGFRGKDDTTPAENAILMAAMDKDDFNWNNAVSRLLDLFDAGANLNNEDLMNLANNWGAPFDVKAILSGNFSIKFDDKGNKILVLK